MGIKSHFLLSFLHAGLSVLTLTPDGFGASSCSCLCVLTHLCDRGLGETDTGEMARQTDRQRKQTGREKTTKKSLSLTFIYL